MTARIILALVMLLIGGAYLAWRLIGTGKGQHAAPRGFAADDERLADTHERVIPRAITEHAPPWEPAFAAAPVIEPRRYDGTDPGLPGGWIHDDGTPCPEYLAPDNGTRWWCTTHEQYLRRPDGGTAPVIEPAAITSGPPDEPQPDAYWLAAGTYNRATGQARTVRVELLPPVAELLGYPTVDDALASMYKRAHALELRELLDGTP